MTATGTDPDGAPASTTITPQADGGIQVQHSVQYNSGGNTYTTNYQITVNDAGLVTNNTQNTVYGGLQNQGTSQTTPPLTIPDDYNREPTQLEIKTEVKKSREALEEQKTYRDSVDVRGPRLLARSTRSVISFRLSGVRIIGGVLKACLYRIKMSFRLPTLAVSQAGRGIWPASLFLSISWATP